ncbi:MAG: hypothetical protein IKE43_05795 [Coriobacteriales bacterium]|nr:hypothetical protein [Coriobacteriales bacterium]
MQNFKTIRSVVRICMFLCVLGIALSMAGFRSLAFAESTVDYFSLNTPTHSASLFEQNTELTSISEQVHAGGLVKQEDLHAWNDRVITNRDVLFIQPWKALTLTNYHEWYLCQPIAKFTYGKVSKYYGYEDFVEALTDGTTLTKYGMVVINAHGIKQEDYRDDGTQRLWMVAAEYDPFVDHTITPCPDSFVYDFALRYGYEVTTYEKDMIVIEGLMRRNSEGTLYISSDLIMKHYQNAVFDNTIFYFGVCYAMRDPVFCNFLLNHGAQCIIANYLGDSSYIDKVYCIGLGDMLPKYYMGGAQNGSTTDESYMRTNTVQEALYSVDESGLSTALRMIKMTSPSLLQRSTDFVLWGYGKMEARVLDANGKPVEGANVGVWRVLDKNFEPYGATKTGVDGSFGFDKIGWGTFVVYVETPDGRTACAQANFGDTYAYLGEIIIAAEAKPDAEKPVEVPGSNASESAKSDTEILELAFERLVQEMGLIPEGQTTYMSKEADQDMHIQHLRSDLNGIAGHVILDLDTDNRQEMIVVRFEPGSVDDEYAGTAPGTRIQIEVFEVGNDSNAVSSARIDFETKSFSWVYDDLRTAVFLAPNGSSKNSGYTLNVYASYSMNDNEEIMRQYAYDGSQFTLLKAEIFWSNDEWCSRFSGSEECSGIISVAQLILYGASSGRSWQKTAENTIDESYSAEAYETFAQTKTALFEAYASELDAAGLKRNTLRFGPGSVLSDFTETNKHRVTEVFDNSDSLIWICEVDAAAGYSTDSQKDLIVCR